MQGRVCQYGLPIKIAQIQNTRTLKSTLMKPPGGSLCRPQPQGLVCDFQNGTLSTTDQGLVCDFQNGTLSTTDPALSNHFQSMTIVRIVNLIQIPNTLSIVQKGNPLHFPHIHPLPVNILACLDASRLAKSGGVAAYQSEYTVVETDPF